MTDRDVAVEWADKQEANLRSQHGTYGSPYLSYEDRDNLISAYRAGASAAKQKCPECGGTGAQTQSSSPQAKIAVLREAAKLMCLSCKNDELLDNEEVHYFINENGAKDMHEWQNTGCLAFPIHRRIAELEEA